MLYIFVRTEIETQSNLEPYNMLTIKTSESTKTGTYLKELSSVKIGNKEKELYKCRKEILTQEQR